MIKRQQESAGGLGEKPERNANIFRAWRDGIPLAQIARKHSISAERVRQIVAKIERFNRRAKEAP